MYLLEINLIFSGRLAAKIARKDSLALKLALRPNRQELIARNIIHEESENERMESKEAIGARLIRFVCSVVKRRRINSIQENK